MVFVFSHDEGIVEMSSALDSVEFYDGEDISSIRTPCAQSSLSQARSPRRVERRYLGNNLSWCCRDRY